jgi:DNA-binding MarR family transcriptional regulator
MVLSALSMAPERTMPMSLLGTYAGATLSRLSNVVSRLEKRGWVQRSPDSSDGRTTLATLTGEGLAVAEKAAPRHVAEVSRLVLDPLTKAQQRQLARSPPACSGSSTPAVRCPHQALEPAPARHRPAAGRGNRP